MSRGLGGNLILRSIAGIGAAAGIGQLIGLLAAPIVSRQFSQEDFGQFGLFFGLSNVLATLALLGLQDALLAAENDRDAKSLLYASAVLCLVTSPCLGLVSFGLIHFNLLGYGALPAWSAVLIALAVGAISAAVLVQIWLIRRTMFRTLALGHLAQGAIRASTQIGAGACGLGYLGLGLSEVTTRAVVVLIMLTRAWGDLRDVAKVSLRECGRVVWRFRLFALFRTPSTLAFNIGTALPPIFVTMGYGVAAAGLYTFMSAVLVVPAGFVQKSIGDVFLGHFAKRFRSDPVGARSFLLRNAAILLLLSVPLAAVLLFWGPYVFSFVFGTQWREAGHLASLTVPLFMADLAIGPLGGALNVANRPELKLVFDLLRIVGLGGAYAIAIANTSSLSTLVLLFAWFGVLGYAIYFGLVLYGIHNPRNSSRPRDTVAQSD